MRSQKNTIINRLKTCALSLLFCCVFSTISYAQELKFGVDSTAVKVGAQITYKIEVETDTTNVVVFPEGQTFMPLEVIESYPTDTTKLNDKYNLIKKYGLTQFDSGQYTIPPQKVVLGNKTLVTDSLKVEINNIVVDSTKQGLYDIKPIIEVKKTNDNWWKLPLYILLALAIIGGVLYWFVWRKKPLTEEEEIALLPPYERAKLALQKLDESHYLEHSEIKEYYSELTLVLRKYLDEKVYNRALESTTDELIARLQLLKEGNQIHFSKETIHNIESILKRADLVKFAKSAPDVALAELDKQTIASEIDHVKEVLPEPDEEEKLLDQKYKEEQERKKKRKKLIISVASAIALIVLVFTGFAVKYGFNYTKDTILGHETKELLEGQWVTSAYGFPPVTVSTPKVLKRLESPVPDGIKDKVQVTAFGYGSLLDLFSVSVTTTRTATQNQSQGQEQGENKQSGIDLNQASEAAIKQFELQKITDITVMREKFSTPNGAEGLKTFGTANIPILNTENYVLGHYVMLHFTSQNVLQQIVITWKDGDVYARDISERILNSVELNKKVQ
ncbi:BatD family protein [Formosa sp. S-31]|uniref:BatD family protein n=1 Tax=Formosa sp. S-31 TaxID=2790949 RepID=UPI003EBF0E02